MTVPYDRLRNRTGYDSIAFPNAELDEIWGMMEHSRDDTDREMAVMAEMHFRMKNNANKLHNYTAGASSHQLAQVKKNLDEAFKELKPYWERGLGTTQKRQVNISTARPIQRREEIPLDEQ